MRKKRGDRKMRERAGGGAIGEERKKGEGGGDQGYVEMDAGENSLQE